MGQVMARTVYDSPTKRDPTSAVEVLAFLLVPEWAMIDGSDDPDAIRELLHSAKRRALLIWYAHHTGDL